MNMNRRAFFVGAGAVAIVVAYPPVLSAMVPEVSQYAGLSGVFPMQTVAAGYPANSPYHVYKMHYRIKTPDTNGIGFTISKDVADPDVDYKDLDELLENIVTRDPEGSEIGEWPLKNRISRAQNKIATDTRRGKGNVYHIVPDGIVVFYMGHNLYDAPFIQTNFGLITNENYLDYFIKITASPKDIDEKFMESQGITKSTDLYWGESTDKNAWNYSQPAS